MSKSRTKNESSSSTEVSDWGCALKVVARPFPGPEDARAALRIAMRRAAYTELTAHARESVDREICGVLVGSIQEDGNGRYANVIAAVRGQAVEQGGQHVTYTQETWTQIHQVIDRDYVGLSIVGWYHSHPGFGVQFSDMDRFIQTNFFSGAQQFGLVTDPLGGETAILINGEKGIAYLDKFWVDGDEQQCWMPPCAAAETRAPDNISMDKRFGELDARLNQVVHTLDETRETVHRTVQVAVMIICTAFVCWIGVHVLRMARAPLPELARENVATVQLPVTLNGTTAVLQVQVDGVSLPDAINPLKQMEQLHRRELMAARLQAQQDMQQQFYAILATVGPAQLEALVKQAKSEMANVENKRLPPDPEDTRTRDKWKTRSLLFALWGTLAILLVAVLRLVYASLREPRTRDKTSSTEKDQDQ
jgi:proteasome lid subunit RPN8/RPN11